MERQRSFTVKSTCFWALSLAISSSIVFFTFFSLWALRSSPLVSPQPTLRFTTPIAPSRSPAGDILPKAPVLIETHVTELEKTAGTSGSSATEVAAIRRDQDQVLRGHSKPNYTVPDVEKLIAPPLSPSGNISSKVPILVDTHIAKDGNSSRFLGSSAAAAAGFAIRRDHSKPGQTGPKIEKSPNGIEASNVKNRGEIDGIRLAGCDLGRGRWVYDESYPSYTNWSCPFIDEGFNCGGNGRPDVGYMKWRWQPQDCQVPRFNATGMLELIRGKRLVFAGDSINRNQWESMLCMLFAAIKDPKKVYETHKRRITKEKGNYCFRFVDYQCTVEYYVTHFLVHESKARVGQKRVPTLRIDAIDHGSSRWRGANILVFNTAHWWSHYKTKAGINYYQEGSQVHPKLDVSTAFRKAMTTWASWINKHVDPRKTQVFFRSSAPSHFSGGEWNTGGHCREAKLPLETISSTGYSSEKSLIVEEVIKSMRTPVTFLNITGISSYRIDAHPSAYGGRPRKGRSSGIEDCSHWCLPGVPDTWNELLYIHLHRKQHNYRQEAA